MTSGIPSATISRLVTYLRILENLEAEAEAEAKANPRPDTEPIKPLTTSSSDLAERAQVSAFQVRKDLAYFGRFGTRGRGYTVPILKRELMRVLGLTQAWNVVILGIGRLGEAIANYPGASEYAFSYVGLFDISDQVVGREVRGLRVQPVQELRAFTSTNRVDMGFLAVPPERAQDAAQALAEAGVKGILNFAPVVLQPRTVERAGHVEIGEEWRGVVVENVDFLAGMKRLAFYILNPNLRDLETEEKA